MELNMILLDRVTSNDDDRKVRDWFVKVTREYGCHHKVRIFSTWVAECGLIISG